VHTASTYEAFRQPNSRPKPCTTTAPCTQIVDTFTSIDLESRLDHNTQLDLPRATGSGLLLPKSSPPLPKINRITHPSRFEVVDRRLCSTDSMLP
jgi:hypothetical protein